MQLSTAGLRRAALVFIVAPVAMSWFVPCASGQLVNGSFENGTYTFGGDQGQDLPVGNTVMTGWTVTTNNVAALNAGNPYAIIAQDGNVSLDLQGYNDGFPYGGVQQVVATSIGQAYDLNFWVGVNNSVGIAQGRAAVEASASDNVPLVSTNVLTGAGMQWQNFDYLFVATSASTTLGLRGTLTTGGAYIGLDNVSLTAVPEPAGAALMLAISGLTLVRRQRS